MRLYRTFSVPINRVTASHFRQLGPWFPQSAIISRIIIKKDPEIYRSRSMLTAEPGRAVVGLLQAGEEGTIAPDHVKHLFYP